MSDAFPLEFGRPWLLLLGAVAIAATVMLARRSMSGLSPARQRFALWLRIVVIVALTLSLADVRLAWRNDDLTVLFLADVSASVPRETVETALVSYARRSQELRTGDQVGLIVFGKDAGVERHPFWNLGSPDAITDINSVIDREGTDLAAALRLADATLEGVAGSGGRRIVVISDGNANRGDELLEARRLALSGTVVDVLPVRFEYRNEIMVDSLMVPPEVHPEEPFAVEAVIRSEVDTWGRVQLYENDRLLETREVELLRGKTRLEFPMVRSDKTRYRYEVRVTTAESDDTLVKNNVGHAFTLVRGEARVLFVGDASQHEALLGALTSSRIAYEAVGPDEVPLQLEDYFLYDCIVVADVAAFELGVDTMRLLHGVVKNLGVGFVMVGGPNAFGAGGYRGTPIEKLLPVDMEVKQREIIPNGALALVLHTCEFPDGNMWAKRIACIAVEALTAEDYVGVLLWDGMGKHRWGVALQRAVDKGSIVNTIMGLQPADMPSFAPTMALAVQGLAQVPATTKHMVIISDGDPTAPSAATMQQILASKISVTTVCINPHRAADTAIMKRLAKDTGGRYYEVKDPRNLPHIFATEALKVRRNLIMEETFTPAVQLVTEPIRGIEQEGFPPLHGYVITSPKALAETALVSHHEDPILSQWRYGLAKTAAFTSDATGRWAADWIGWSGFETLWAQLVRSVSRRGATDIFRVERTIEGDRGKILLDALDPDGRFIDNLEVEGRIVDPQFDEQVVDFQQTGPGRYEASFNASRSGSYLMNLEYSDGAGFEGATQTGLNVSYSPEYRELENDEERLAELAAATGGRVLELADDPFDRNFPIRLTRTPQWERLLQFLLLLFFVDIFLRRVRVELAPLQRLWARIRRRAPAADVLRGATSSAVEAVMARRGDGRPRTLQTVSPEDGDDDRVPSTPDAARPGPAPGAAEPAPESFTDRLLKAKREARERQQRD